MKFLYKEFFDRALIEKIEKSCLELKDSIRKAAKRWGFLQIKSDDELTNYFKKQEGRWKRFVQVGMGGSVLGAQALCSFLGVPESKSVKFIDDIGDSFFSSTYSSETLYHIVSKSGSTTETIANFIHLINHLNKKQKEQIIISTGESGFLKEYADKHGIKRFLIPENVGGRYSLFSPVGMAVANFLGYDTEKLIEGARQAIKNLASEEPTFAYLFAVIASEFLKKGKSNLVLFCYSEKLLHCVYWFRQLWAESLGKLVDKNGNRVRVGQTPIVARGASDQHSQLQLYREGPLDKLFCFIQGPVEKGEKLRISPEFKQFDYLSERSLGEIKQAEYEATKQTIAKDSPVVSIEVDSSSEYSFGLLTMNLMIATAITGEILNIDAFNQPGVELGKRLTKQILKNEI